MARYVEHVFYSNCFTKIKWFYSSIEPDQSNTPAGAVTTKAITGAEFKERAAFNRRRGAMRRRVHQVAMHIFSVYRALNLIMILSLFINTNSFISIF